MQHICLGIQSVYIREAQSRAVQEISGFALFGGGGPKGSKLFQNSIQNKTVEDKHGGFENCGRGKFWYFMD